MTTKIKENEIDINEFDDHGYIISFKYERNQIWYQGVLSGDILYTTLPINSVIQIRDKLTELIIKYATDNKLKPLEEFTEK